MPTPLPRLSLQLAFLLSGTFTHAFRLGTRAPTAAGLCFPHRALSSSSSSSSSSSKALVSTLLSSSSSSGTSSSSSSSSSLSSSLSSSSWGSNSSSSSSSSSSSRSSRNARSNRSMSSSSSSSSISPPLTMTSATTTDNNDNASPPASSDPPKRKRGRPSNKAKATARAAAAAETSVKEEGKGEALPVLPVEDQKVTTTTTQIEEELAGATTAAAKKPRVKKETPAAAAAAAPAPAIGIDEDLPSPSPPAKRGGRKKKELIDDATAPATAASAASASAAAAAAAAPPTKAKRAPPQRESIPRTSTPRIEGGPPPASLPSSSASSSSQQKRKLLRLLSWNVAGLRGLLKKGDTIIDAFRSLLLHEKPDILCLQETKLQEDHVAEVSAALRALHLPQYEGNWHCSTAKKGYSGTSILISEEAGLSLGPGGVTCGIEGEEDGEGEGRVITIDFEKFSLVNVYTPNSGEGLKRLQFRTEKWDRAFERHLKELQQGKGGREGGRAVLCCGDLNVAFGDADFFNPDEPRMAKAAGTTPEERASFGRLLQEAGMVDTFRYYHPEATGCYSYWSMRAGNRPFNRGMRLDYFLASRNMMGGEKKVGKEGEGVPRVLDSFILDQATVGLSDHAPVGVLVEL